VRYRTDQALFAPEIKARSECREAHFYLGEVDRQAHRYAEAARHYEAALAERPGILAYVDTGAALQNLGTVRIELGRFGDARVAFRAALEGTKDPRVRRELTHNLAAVALRQGDVAETERLLREETSRADAMPQSLYVRAVALERLGRGEEARALRDRLPATRSE
jgi:tetratricopeptide (TPR) repeat protein